MKKLYKFMAAALLLAGGTSVATAQTSLGERTFRIHQQNADNYLEEVFQPFKSEIIYQRDGTIRISDFANSGAYLDFKIESFGEPDASGVSSAAVTFPDGSAGADNNTKLSASGTITRYRFYNGTWIPVTLSPLNGADPIKIAKPYVYETYDYEDGSHFYYSEAYKWEEDGVTVQQVQLDLWTSDASIVMLDDVKNSGHNFILFYVTGETEEWTTAVKDINIDDENAPVEYFNLQGVRVENPENGIFIRRQGSKTSKVAL